MTFYSATKSLAKMIDSQGDWVPVPSLIDQNSFRPFCLLQKKRKTSWWQSCPFHKTDYQLYHLLLSGNDTSSLVQKTSELFALEESVDGMLKGDISGITDTEITSAVSISHERSVKMKKIHVPIEDLDSLMKEKKINNEHPFIKQSKMLQRNLYLITASAETVETTTFGESNKVESSVFHKAYIKLSLEGARDRKKIITIPKGCVLAFKAKKLFIGEETVGMSYYSTDKRGTFLSNRISLAANADSTPIPFAADADFFKVIDMSLRSIGDGMSYHSTDKRGTFHSTPIPFAADADFFKVMDVTRRRIGDAEKIPKPADFKSFVPVWKNNKKNLRKEVEKEYVPFSLMSLNLRGIFLTSFVVLMKKSDLLEKLELQLEQVLEDPEQFRLNMDESEFKDLLDNLHDVKGAIVTELAEATLYFLQALDELTEIQIMLLIESVEKKIVSQQLNLVEGILDEYFWNEKQNFTVKIQQLPEEEWYITGALIEETSGISIQRSGCTVTGSILPDSSSNLTALYVALFAIDLLSKKSF